MKHRLHFSSQVNFVLTLIMSILLVTPLKQIYAQNNSLSPIILKQSKQFGEWKDLAQQQTPTLMWWNERMPMVPVLYILFYPQKIILNAISPLWPDTGILFYIKDKTEKLGINLILDYKDNQNSYYTAVIYGNDRQNFVNNLVTSHKARLITPSSYSQSLSLKHVDQAMQYMIVNNPQLNLTFPKPKQ
ncbi:hypothetical protein COMNV_01669 [Commensalibacter sp. Nvir]|uniref:hypothetical protein n=1 Tax=Commensalibacter sp. Nvir TaxID=3069817 RepID=UPI002D2BCD83|nr:hypothetical protein COMNV_01669 [Commensalibacter sp. Nvir]